MDWLLDLDTLTAIGSVGAVIIAVVALVVSHRGQSAQRLREQREELRGLLERLVTLREEGVILVKEREESVRAATGVWQHTRRMIYLDAAEALARELLPHLTASELSVVAMENQYEGDSHEARFWYEHADRKSAHTSPMKRADVLRNLATTYYVSDPALFDPPAGAAVYRRAIEAVNGRLDAYSRYTRALIQGTWAASEMFVQRLDEASDLLDRAWQEWQSIPTNQALVWLADMRSLAVSCGHLGTAWFNSPGQDAHDRGRAAYRKGLEITTALSERYGGGGDYTVDVRGSLLQWWGQSELSAGDLVRGGELLDDAQQTFSTLSTDFVWRAFRLGELEQARVKEPPAPPDPAATDTALPVGVEDITPAR